MTPVLAVNDLSVRFRIDEGEVTAVNGLSFELNEGECLGIVGESGSGKSQTFLAALGLLADNGIASGSVRFRGQEILNAPRTVLDELRGNRLAMIFQDALSGLTPTMRIGEQMAEVLMRHTGASRAAARARALEALEVVRIPAAAERLRSYPFELSGGMRQRVMIAMATLCRPEVVIADEPTTALDVTVQAEVLRLLKGLKEHTRMALVLITHDLAVVAGLCDRVLIMYGGRVAEAASVRDIFTRPRHPYTQALLRSVPSLAIDPARDLPAIPGQPPNLEALPPGCAFADRCAQVMERCRHSAPTLRRVGDGQLSACHLEARP